MATGSWEDFNRVMKTAAELKMKTEHPEEFYWHEKMVSFWGRYRMEVEECPDEGWDWSVYDVDDEILVEQAYNFAPDKLTAGAEAETALRSILRREGERPAISHEDYMAKIAEHVLHHVKAWQNSAKCQFCGGEQVHDCPGGEYITHHGMLGTISPGKVDARAFPRQENRDLANEEYAYTRYEDNLLPPTTLLTEEESGYDQILKSIKADAEKLRA